LFIVKRIMTDDQIREKLSQTTKAKMGFGQL